MTIRPTLITGGGGGIGRAVSTLLRERGNPVAVADLDLDAAEATVAAGAGAPALALEVDVTDSASVRACVQAAERELGGLGGLVSCAGMHRPTPLAETDDEFARRLIDVNFLGTFYACREARDALAAHGSGRIVNIGSDSSRAGLPKGSVYSAMKGAVNSLTRSLAMELARDGITVNCVSPGTIDTEMLRKASDVAEGQIRKLTAMVPLRRLGTPEDVASTIAFLVSDEASYITAQIIPVNGGIIAG
jgi:2-hydroxycyclohexanecarboxyl-CoA dehydrogenase